MLKRRFGGLHLRSHGVGIAVSGVAFHLSTIMTDDVRRVAVLSALTRHSGPLGISVILPETSSHYLVQDKMIVKHALNEEQPHMPLTREWRNTDFSVEGVLGVGKWGRKVDLKDWCERWVWRRSFKQLTGKMKLTRTPSD